MASEFGTWTLESETGALQQVMGRMMVSTRGDGFVAITDGLNHWLSENQVRDGLLTLFLCHTSASLTIQENTDPDVQADIVDALDRLAPQNVAYRHAMEGADDMPAHIKTVLCGVSLQVPVVNARLDLGTWQAVYVVEHRARAHQRSITMHYLGS